MSPRGAGAGPLHKTATFAGSGFCMPPPKRLAPKTALDTRELNHAPAGLSQTGLAVAHVPGHYMAVGIAIVGNGSAGRRHP